MKGFYPDIELTGYLGNNQHRTDSPLDIRNGWQIGSGKVESACKNVVARRLTTDIRDAHTDGNV